MELKLNELDKVKRELNVEATDEELTPRFEKAITEYRKKISHPGFRKGKVPISIVKNLYGESIKYSSLEEIAQDIFREYIVDNKTDLIGKGTLLDMDYKPEEGLKFKVKFEVFPEVEIENYKGIELKKKKYLIDESLVDEEINYHKFRNSTQELDGVALDNEYIITVDLQNLDEAGNILIGQTQKDLRVYLGNPEIYKEFKEAFKGIKEGEEKVIDSMNAEGGPKKVRITCKKVEKIVYPEMNPEFFSKVTGKEGINTLEEFREEIKKELSSIYNNIAERNLRDEVVSEIIKLNEVEVPEHYTETILNSMLEDQVNQMPNKKLPPEFKPEEFKKENRVNAIRLAKWFLIRDKLIELENVDVDDSDFQKLAEDNFKKYNIPVDKLFNAYKENADIKNKLINEKVIDMIISNAKLEEIEELRKKDDKSIEDTSEDQDV